MAKAKTKYLTKALRCPDGTRKYIRGKTQTELDRKVREAQAQLGMGININDNTTVWEFAQVWVDVYKRPNLKPQSVKSLLNVLNKHITPNIGAMRVRDVKPADCARVLSLAKDLAKGTQDIIITTMRTMFSCAIENRIIAQNPVTRSIKSSGRRAKERVPLTVAQMDELCAIAMTHRDPRFYTYVLLCGYAGLRSSEALGLHMGSVDLEKGCLTVKEQYCASNGKGGTTPELKTESSYRTVPIPLSLLIHLQRLKEQGCTGYIFDVSQPGLAKRYYSSLTRVCAVDANGNATGRKKRSIPVYAHPHLLRHTYATRCFEAGLDIKAVQYLLGHSTLEMTMNLYVHYMAESRRDDTARKVEQAFPHTLVAVI